MADAPNVLDVGPIQISTPAPYSFNECKKQLLMDFKNIYAKDVTDILKFNHGHYSKAYKCLVFIMDKVNNTSESGIEHREISKGVTVTIKDGQKKAKTFMIHTMSRNRLCRAELNDELRQEIERAKEEQKRIEEEENRRVALNILKKEYSELGQLIECLCCFDSCVFENMAQCMEGHLICVDCLNAITKEVVFGAGKVGLQCMMPDCTAIYPQSELERCITLNTWHKLKENLVRCPYCDFAAILPSSKKVFRCCRENCQKATCRDCGADWKGHEGLPCSKIESRNETALRKEYEEKMTKAKVRTCSKCNAQFTKESGCNKIICRCGQAMCYICRAPHITIKHFCRHPNGLFKACSICSSCPLWTFSEQDDDRAIEEIRREAHAKRKALGYAGDKDIGAPPKIKRIKLGHK